MTTDDVSTSAAARARLGPAAVALVYVALVGAYVLTVAGLPFAAHQAGHEVVGTDSVQILAAARHAFWSPAAGLIPPLYILLVQLCARRVAAITYVQSALYVASWLWLAAELRRCLQYRVTRTVAPLLLLVLSLAPELLLWTVTIGTESLSVTLSVAMVAALLALVRTRRPRDLVVFVVIIVFGAFARDTNVVLAGVVAIVAAFIAIRWRAVRGRAVAVVVVCVAAALAANALSSQAQPPRWFYPLQDVVLLRMFPHAAARRYLVEHGMPVNATLVQVAEPLNYFLRTVQIQQDPRLAPFRLWLRQKGPSTYASYLATHPGEAITGPFDGRNYILAPSFAGYALVTHDVARPGAIYGVFGAIAFWRIVPLVLVWIVLALAGALWCIRRRRADRALVGALATVVLVGIVHAMLAYLGDSLEVGRHALTANAQVRVGLWALTLVLVDRVPARTSSPNR